MSEGVSPDCTEVPIKLKHEAEMWERLQQDIERLRNEKAALVVSGKEALTRAKTEAADELQRVRRYSPLYSRYHSRSHTKTSF